jgi:phage shock protein PspC (stress-responsive transcriptional regulator)
VRKLSYFCPAKHKSNFIAQYDKMTKRLRRNSQDQVIAGVASGIADYFGMESWVTRILFIILFFSGGGVLVYIIMWIALPESDYQNQNPMEEQKQKTCPKRKWQYHCRSFTHYCWWINSDFPVFPGNRLQRYLALELDCCRYSNSV